MATKKEPAAANSGSKNSTHKNHNTVSGAQQARATLPAEPPGELARRGIEEMLASNLHDLAAEVALKDLAKRTKLGIIVLRREYREALAAKQKIVQIEAAVAPSERAVRIASWLQEQTNLLPVFKSCLRRRGYIAHDLLAGSLLLSHGSLLLEVSTAWAFWGPFAAGKSDAAIKAADFLPAGKIIVATKLSPKSLYYLNDIKGKILNLGELNPQRDDEDDLRQEALRQLISENRISLLSVGKPVGQQVNQSVTTTTDGPAVMVFSSTTDPHRWDPQLQSRCSWVRADDSPDTTLAVLKSVADRASSTRTRPISKGWTEGWQLFYSNLKPLKVLIPFAHSIAPTGRHAAIRRVYNLMLQYVTTLALLHQHTRKLNFRDGVSYIEASWDDYRLAYRLVNANAPRVLATVSHEAKHAFETKIEPLKGKQKFLIGPEIKQLLGVSKSQSSRWVGDYISSGMLLFAGKEGTKHRYEFPPDGSATMSTDDELGLIPPEKAMFDHALRAKTNLEGPSDVVAPTLVPNSGTTWDDANDVSTSQVFPKSSGTSETVDVTGLDLSSQNLGGYARAIDISSEFGLEDL